MYGDIGDPEHACRERYTCIRGKCVCVRVSMIEIKERRHKSKDQRHGRDGSV